MPDPTPAPGRSRVPVPAIVAVVLLEVIAFGALAFAFLLLLVTGALGVVPDGVVTGTAIGSAAIAVAAVPAGIGVWRGRAWGWAIALVIAVVGLLAVGAALVSGGLVPELVVGLVLFGGLLGCLVARPVRSRSGRAGQEPAADT